MSGYTDRDVAKSRVRAMRAYTRRQALLETLKTDPCMDCGGTFPPECMDFDHRDPAEKIAGVKTMKTRGIAAMMTEIAKCDLVCSNCHRIRTRRRASDLRLGRVNAILDGR